MTRKQLLVSLIVLIAFILIVSPDILGSIFALVFLGMIPGTDYSVPSIAMFIVYGAIALLVIRWLARQPMYIGNKSKQEKTARTLARKKVLNKRKPTPKRRVRKTAKA